MKIIPILIISLYLFSCSSTIPVNSTYEANYKIGNKKATIYMKSDKKYKAQNIIVKKDYTLFLNTETQIFQKISTHDILSVQTTEHAFGAPKDFLWGGIVLGSLGYVFGGYDPNSSSTPKDSERFSSFLEGAIIGAPIGGIVGVIIGHHNNYIFPEDSILEEKGQSCSDPIGPKADNTSVLVPITF